MFWQKLPTSMKVMKFCLCAPTPWKDPVMYAICTVYMYMYNISSTSFFNSATRKALTTTLYDNFLLSFPHILTPNLWRPGVQFRSYLRNFLYMYMHMGPKKAQNVILCTKSMQIEFFLLVHIYAYFYSQWLKLICFGIIVLQKVSTINFAGKNNKSKRKKKQRNT